MLRRIYVLILAVVVVAIVASGASAFFVIKSYHSQVSQEYLYNAAQLIEQRLAAGDDFVQAAQAISSVYQRDGESIRVTVIQTDGTVAYDNLSDSTQMENHLYRPEIRAALQNQGVGFARRTSETIGKQMLYLATYAPALNLVVRTSISYDIERSGYLGLVTTLLIVAGLSMVALLLIGYLALRQITRPLVELKQAANQVQRGDYQIRVGSLLDDKSELTDLGNAFNAMARQLSQTIQSLEERNTRLDVILNSLVVPLIVAAQSHDVMFVNRTAQDLFDRHLDPDQARFPLVLVTHHAQTEAMIDDCLKRNSPVSRELTISTVRGPRDFQITASPIRYTNQDNVILTFLDISQSRLMQRMRSEFVANVTHELKTPLTSIRGFIETLRHGAIDKPDVARRFLDIIDIEAERLHQLISDILVLSEIEELKEDKDKQTFDLHALIDDVVVLLDDIASSRKISLVPETDESALMVSANPHRIKQVLINLVENAIKYNREGGRVEIHTRRLPNGKLELRVRDTGPGIAPEHQDRIFERFYRVDTSRSRELGGTGLGLSIVKHIAQLYGGTARVESKIGQGATFIVELAI